MEVITLLFEQQNLLKSTFLGNLHNFRRWNFEVECAFECDGKGHLQYESGSEGEGTDKNEGHFSESRQK